MLTQLCRCNENLKSAFGSPAFQTVNCNQICDSPGPTGFTPSPSLFWKNSKVSFDGQPLYGTCQVLTDLMLTGRRTPLGKQVFNDVSSIAQEADGVWMHEVSEPRIIPLVVLVQESFMQSCRFRCRLSMRDFICIGAAQYLTIWSNLEWGQLNFKLLIWREIHSV